MSWLFTKVIGNWWFVLITAAIALGVPALVWCGPMHSGPDAIAVPTAPRTAGGRHGRRGECGGSGGCGPCPL